jgi:glycerate dehydrogenase
MQRRGLWQRLGGAARLRIAFGLEHSCGAARCEREAWSRQPHFTYHLAPLRELAGKVFGIYGLGRIGQQAARIAQGFGMSVLAAHKHPRRDAMPGVRFVDLTTLFSQSDVVSLHAPLGPDNEGIVNEKLLRLAKPSAILINTSRGGLINEADLERALRGGWLAAAALDVLKQEPPGGDHPLLALDNCRLTPHLAWATFEARERLMGITADNVAAFLEGQPQNVVNGVMARPA